MRISNVLGAAAIAAVFAFSGCGKKGGGAEKEFEGYVNEVCACKDMKCVTDAGAKFAEKHKNDKPGKASKPSKKMEELTKKMTDCTTKITEEEMKKAQGAAGGDQGAAGGDQAGKPKPNWPNLTKEDCEKAARKWNIECAVKGAPPPKDPDGMIKMVVDTCLMTPDDLSSTVPMRAQIACLDKADCKEYKDCVETKEGELKAELGE